MDISRQNAMQIVTEISGIIQQHVNMMDETGVIVASTDPARIETYHEGAARVIREQLNELLIEQDGLLAGSRKGINLPIVLDGVTVGVIGLTGEYDEVVKYGQIIKKMTEILLRENLLNQQKKIDDRIRTRFLDEWILEGAPLTTVFVERGTHLGIDTLLPYRVIVAAIADIRRYSDSPEGQVLIDRVNSRVRHMVETLPGGIFTKTANRMICLLPAAAHSDAYALALANKIEQQMQSSFSLPLLIGIDSPCDNVHHAYLQAGKALLACSLVAGKTICMYKDIYLEIFMGEVSGASRRAFIQRIFQGFSAEEIGTWVAILQAYFTNNGSISKTAEQLFIHKNTLQYKFKRLYEKTGHDPRKLADLSLFHLAVQFYSADEM